MALALAEQTNILHPEDVGAAQQLANCYLAVEKNKEQSPPVTAR